MCAGQSERSRKRTEKQLDSSNPLDNSVTLWYNKDIKRKGGKPMGRKRKSRKKLTEKITLAAALVAMVTELIKLITALIKQ